MDAVIFLVFIVLFVVFLFSLSSVAEGRSRSATTFRPNLRHMSQRGPHITRAAAVAMRQAGYESGPAYVQITDLGLLTYRNPEEPKLVRYGDVMMDTRFLRPFVELWLPYAATGMVRLEIQDSEKRIRYADEAEYDLEQGKNMVLPNTWLPLEGKSTLSDDWTLRVLSSDTLLAQHRFGWRRVGGGALHRYVANDGEISPELRQAAQASARQAVSLDELLSDQEE
ncbi:MAG: hypothetical protein JW966_03650 [Anaerolineae bacterium]|nr:hypothetical protein [Anaerolineae bacterium]